MDPEKELGARALVLHMWCPPLGVRPSSLTSLFGTLLICAITGCAANLANPQDFADRPNPAGGAGGSSGAAGSGGSGTAGSAGSGPIVSTPDCVLTLFKTGSGSCSGSVCHDQGVNAAGGLDLASPNVAARLVDQVALHTAVGPTDVCPTGDKLIDTSNPTESWLLKKLSATGVGMCGSVMPLGGTLSADQLSCLQDWINSVQPGAT